MSDQLILKVQRPLYSTDPDEHWLFYDVRRRVYLWTAAKNITDDLKRAMGDEYKIYIHADYNKETGTVGFLSVAPEQVW